MHAIARSSAFRLPASRHRSLTPSHFGRSRFASSSGTTEGAPKAANDALGAVQKNALRAWETLRSFLGPLSARAGNMLGSYREPLFYNFAVARALLKHVYVAERLQPPLTLDAWRSAYSTMWSHAASRSWWREAASNGELARVGIYALEAYGIFKIGEMLGRRSIVGYKLR